MINKRSYVSQVVYNVSDPEKQQAKKCITIFTFLSNQIDELLNHFKLMKDPFNNSDINSEKLFEQRVALRRFRDEGINKYEELKRNCFFGVLSLMHFSSDTQIDKLVKIIKQCMGKIEEEINSLKDLFNNIKSSDFVKNTVECITKLENECNELSKIIKERVLSHLRNNILSKSWLTDESEISNMEIKTPEPLYLQLEKKYNK